MGFAEHVARVRERMPTGFSWVNLKIKDHLKSLSIDVRMILKRRSQEIYTSLDRINLTLGRHKWLTVAKTVMKLRFP
jgi:hypothetical protein